MTYDRKMKNKICHLKHSIFGMFPPIYLIELPNPGCAVHIIKYWSKAVMCDNFLTFWTKTIQIKTVSNK